MTRTSAFWGAPPDAVEAVDEKRCESCDYYSVKINSKDDNAGKCFRDHQPDRKNQIWWVECWMTCAEFEPDLMAGGQSQAHQSTATEPRS